MKKFLLGMLVLAVMAGGALAQTPDAGWEVIVVREATNGTDGPPLILPNAAPGGIEVVTFAGGQKAALGTDMINGATVGQIATLHVDRLDVIGDSGALYAPYFNIWITDGLGNYAVIANEPSDAEWDGSRWDVSDWNFLKTKRCKVYETAGWNTNSSWVHTYAGISDPLTFEDVEGLIIEPPSPAYIAASAFIGSGAPDEIVTNVAYGYNWVFGDTQANYVSGDPGVIVNNYSATASYPVNNVTQGLGYNTITAAIAGAAAGNAITVDAGTYAEFLHIDVDGLSITGADEATVIIDPTGLASNNAGVYVDADNVTISTLTVNSTVTTTLPRYGIKFGEVDGCLLTGVTVTEVYRSGVDCLGTSNLAVTDVTITGNGGHGLSLVDCNNVTVTDLTSTGNGWQNCSVATWGRYSPLGTSGIVFTGTNDFGDLFQLEMGDYNNPGVAPAGDAVITYSTSIGDMADVTVQAATFGFAVHGEQDDSPDQVRIWFVSSLANAALVPANAPFGHWSGNDMYIESLTDDHMYVTDGGSIKAAIAAAVPGGTVNVASGTYVENGQILVDKNISVIGELPARPVVMTNQNTGGSGDARGWWLQTAGTTLLMENLELDGSGFDIYQGLRTTGNGDMVNCALSNMVYPGYGGVGIAAFGGTFFNVTGCSFDNMGRIGILNWTGGTFSGNTYTGKGIGDWLDYAVDTNAGAVMVIEDNTITACQGVASSDGSTSAALLVTTFSGAGTTATINNNILTGNTTGLAVGYDGADGSVVSGTGNDFSGNSSFGVSNSSLTNSVDFLGNWWGAASGPFHAGLNPLGTGVPVGDNILFDPWSGYTYITATPSVSGPLACGVPVTLTFSLTTDGYTPDVFGYNVVVRSTSEVDFGAITSLNIFGVGTTGYYNAFSPEAGVWDISGTTFGSPSNPITTAGTHDLFTVVFTANSDGLADITFDLLKVRDPSNGAIPVAGTGATIEVDCTAPAAVTAITAAPGHNKVDVTWTHAGADVDHFEVHRGLWYAPTVGISAYPEYDDVGAIVPTRPAIYGDLPDVAGEWIEAGSTATAVNAFTDLGAVGGSGAFDPAGAHRGVYYYEVFAVDAAGNASAVAAANDRATNYWLGDVTGVGGGTPNGQVQSYDITALGASFGLSHGETGYNNETDVGPTYNWSSLGIPTTDNIVDFEDLIVFSMNYGVVSAAKSAKPVKPISQVVDLAWVRYDDGRQALRLVDGSGMKGLNIRTETRVSGVVAGDLLDKQDEMTFLRNVGQNLDVSVAVMGVEVGFTGSGDLFVLDADSQIDVADLTIKVRGHDNSRLEFTMNEKSGSLTPRVFALNPNYPNPFNPMTKISFSLPEAQDVRLEVYGIDGRKVATLINEQRGPGLHEVIWNGQDDSGRQASSGMYFYRINAGPYSAVHKMTLMK